MAEPRFGEMDLLPGPQGSTLFPPMRIRIEVLVDEHCGGRKISRFSPAQLPVFFKEGGLEPDPLEDSNGRKLPEPVKIGCLEAGRQDVLPVSSNALGQSEAIPL